MGIGYALDELSLAQFVGVKGDQVGCAHTRVDLAVVCQNCDLDLGEGETPLFVESEGDVKGRPRFLGGVVCGLVRCEGGDDFKGECPVSGQHHRAAQPGLG